MRCTSAVLTSHCVYRHPEARYSALPDAGRSAANLGAYPAEPTRQYLEMVVLRAENDHFQVVAPARIAGVAGEWPRPGAAQPSVVAQFAPAAVNAGARTPGFTAAHGSGAGRASPHTQTQSL